jgi:outer membrane receptor for ferrienterochelin and colicins
MEVKLGGLINIITKNPKNARFFADAFATGWGEVNVDIGFKANIGNAAAVLTGINYFNYSNPIDNNKDNFTDLTLQDGFRFSKMEFQKGQQITLSQGVIFMKTDGEANYNGKKYRGGTDVYGESIYTKRWELLGAYELPIAEKCCFHFLIRTTTKTPFMVICHTAKQRIGFGQLTWDKEINNHDLLFWDCPPLPILR